jgi:hypothetical protein
MGRMGSFKMRFIIGTLSDDELRSLKRGDSVISKMLLIPDDYRLFHYKEGDDIEAETQEGNRIWTTIHSMEVVEEGERVIIIFTLIERLNTTSSTDDHGR